MRIHDWCLVSAEIFHDFHTSWLAHIKESLNADLLPANHYALAEQQAVEASDDTEYYLARRRSVVIRHSGDDRVIAIIEVVSPANNHSVDRVNDFCEKVSTALKSGVRVLVIDLVSNTNACPAGMHGAIWDSLLAGHYAASKDAPLTMAAYCACRPIKAFIEPTAIGQPIIDMPLFLTPSHYVTVPLVATYEQSFAGVPQRWRSVIEA